MCNFRETFTYCYLLYYWRNLYSDFRNSGKTLLKTSLNINTCNLFSKPTNQIQLINQVGRSLIFSPSLVNCPKSWENKQNMSKRTRHSFLDQYRKPRGLRKTSNRHQTKCRTSSSTCATNCFKKNQKTKVKIYLNRWQRHCNSNCWRKDANIKRRRNRRNIE